MTDKNTRKTSRTLKIKRNALESNETAAIKNKSIFGKTFVMNFLSSPGSGKTSLLESIIPILKENGLKTAVIEGDVDTDLDKKRIDALNVPAYQIITNGSCHLDAAMVYNSLGKLDFKDSDVLFIENVGNLVCPTSFNLGEDIKVVVLSVTEGDDKPLKYPAAFYKSTALVINKIDLVPYLKTDVDAIEKNALSINKDIKIFRTSCFNAGTADSGNKLENGLSGFVDYIKENIRAKAALKNKASLNTGMGL